MSFDTLRKRIALSMIALAIMPLLFGSAVHCLAPCVDEHPPRPTCCSHNTERQTEHEDTSVPQESCFVCDFLAMPRDATPTVAMDCVLDLVERREPEPVRMFVVLYRSFEPGRAPPTLS